MARAKPPKPGKPKSIPVTLPWELAVKLWAYQQVNSGALQGQIVCDALDLFFGQRLKENPQMEQRFNEVQARFFRPTADVMKIVDRPTRKSRSGGRER